MEGRGVVNYSVDKPSYAISTETTEFDDELIRRGIISFEESMMRKGASDREAMRLAKIREEDGKMCESDHEIRIETEAASRETSADFTDDTEDSDGAFLEQYRQKRLQAWKKEQQDGQFGEVFLISRQDWARHVNDASHISWVVICLTSSNVERTGCIENVIAILATRYRQVKFVAIPHQQAIANWPEHHLPTLFLYRYGVMQHQLLSLPTTMTLEQLEWNLAQLGVLETDLEEEPISQQPVTKHVTSSYRGSVFGGLVSEMKTRELEGSMNAYDDVD